MNARLRSVGIVVLALTVAGCAQLGALAPSPTQQPIRSDPEFVGFIVEVEPRAGQIVTESHADKIVTRYVLTISDSTAVFEKDGEAYRPAGFDAFERQQWIWVWFTAPAPDEFGATVDALQVAIILD
jgi:hypothetical protein